MINTYVGRNQYDLLPRVLSGFRNRGIAEQTRNGEVLRLPGVTVILQERPWERVYVDPIRDSNPFFHLVEALAMLANKNDAQYLSYFAKNMMDFCDDGQRFNSFYGERARSHFGWDQFKLVIRTLRDDPQSRQAVVQLWDPADLTWQSKDKACNMSIVFSIDEHDRLCMTTFNRSNDAIWGYFGANAVHFSVFQEYVARNLDLAIGPWIHVSNNFHGYRWNEKFRLLLDRAPGAELVDRYATEEMFATELWSDTFETDLGVFIDWSQRVIRAGHVRDCLFPKFHSTVFKDIIHPMISQFFMHKVKEDREGYYPFPPSVRYHDWVIAAQDWFSRRSNKA